MPSKQRVGGSNPFWLTKNQEAVRFKRLNLTAEQKAKLDTIKAEEQKKLEPIRNKMKKKHEEMRELIQSEAEIRKSSMDKFEALLTAEQKAELEKMKAEIQEKMKNDFGAPGGPREPRGHRGPGMHGPHHPMGPAPMEPAPNPAPAEAPEK